MIIKTRNSTYRITPLHTNFEVEKIAETSPNPHGMNIGWKRTCKVLSIGIGDKAFFGNTGFSGTYTSIVTEVYDESHEPSR